ncbi:MAG: PAS domain-containing protein [Candidatus Omnitrophica bacterium]|nr:PAS domain-containing protein [Candidatus Omnitrophota bacterium]
MAMNFYRMVQVIEDLKNVPDPVDKKDSEKTRFSQKKAEPKSGEHNNFLEFLSSKAKVFDEFEEMSSFAASILRASSYPFFVVDKNMKIQYMNPACLDFTGLKLNDAIGKVKCMRVFNSDLCEKNCAIKQAMTTQKSVIGKRVKVQDKFDREHTIIVTAGPLIDKRGRVLGGFEVWRDAMPDEEVTLRINRLLDTLKNYCWSVESFLEGIEKRPFSKELENKENWDRLINGMKKRTNDLQDYCKNLLKSSCWDILNCPAERQVQCPAFPNHGVKCWDVDYTWCDGQMQGTAEEKINKCKKCSVYSREKDLRL